MRNSEYAVTQHHLMMCVEFLVTLDLDEFINQIEMSEAMGPLLNPTAWMRLNALGGGEALRKVKAVAKEARELQKVFCEAWPEKAARLRKEKCFATGR